MQMFSRRNLRFSMRLAALLAVASFFNFNAAHGQYADWFEADLEPVWQAQVEAGRGTGGAAHVVLHVSNEQFTITHELIHNEKSTFFAPEDLDVYGNPIGIDGAAKAADVARRTLEKDGLKSELITHRIPKVTLFAQTVGGTLHVIDGETGETRKVFSNGDPTLTSLAPAANDQYAAVINGSTLYVLDLEKQKAAFQRRLGGAPSGGPAISNESVFVPMVGGLVESYRLKTDRKFRVPQRFKSAGNVHVRPMVGDNTVSWPTDRGFLYVVDTKYNKVRYRLEARSDLVSHSTFLPPNRLLAASVEGYVFCFNDTTGGMSWEFSAGESLINSPVAAGEQVFAVSAQSNLFAVNAKTGKEMWKTPGVKQVLSVGKDRVYCLGNRQLLILDRNAGGIIDSTPLSGNERFITNNFTDRIYLASRTGRIVCLRQQGATWPTIHRDVKAPATVATPLAEKADSSADELTDAPPVTAEAADAEMAADDGGLFGGGDPATTDGDDLFGDDPPAGGGDGDDLFGDGDMDDLFN